MSKHNISHNSHGGSDALMVPKVCTDFVFDLYDSVTTSQIPQEQTKLYKSDFIDLNNKYFSTAPYWPSPQAIASECNGHPLFLALYREMTHRQWHAVSRPSIRDRCEGWNVYRELFEEILEQESFYILPSWCFDILHEFVYQFQGFCQVRAAVFASARKHGLMNPNNANANTNVDTADGTASTTTTNTPTPSSTLLENFNALQSTEAWDVEAVFGYLHRLIQIGMPNPKKSQPVVYTYLSAFASVALSRLECLLGDYTACLEALERPLKEHYHTVLPAPNTSSKTPPTTLGQVVHSVLGARLSIAYHSGVSYLMLRRYKDAIRTLGDMCAGFAHVVALETAATAAALPDATTSNPRDNRRGKDFHNKGGGDQNSAAAQQQAQLMKQYDRMICLLVILTQLVPSASNTTTNNSNNQSNQNNQNSSTNALITDDATRKAIREKTKDSFSYEEFFASPKFISVHNSTTAATATGTGTTSNAQMTQSVPFHRQQVQLFLKEMQLQQPYRTLRSYLKLYTSLPLSKLAGFYDLTCTAEVLPLLLSYKTRMRQLQQDVVIIGSTSSSTNKENDDNNSISITSSSSYKMAMDIHYYIVDEMCHIDEPEKQRRFETHFFAQIAQTSQIAKQISALAI